MADRRESGEYKRDSRASAGGTYDNVGKHRLLVSFSETLRRGDLVALGGAGSVVGILLGQEREEAVEQEVVLDRGRLGRGPDAGTILERSGLLILLGLLCLLLVLLALALEVQGFQLLREVISDRLLLLLFLESLVRVSNDTPPHGIFFRHLGEEGKATHQVQAGFLPGALVGRGLAVIDLDRLLLLLLEQAEVEGIAIGGAIGGIERSLRRISECAQRGLELGRTRGVRDGGGLRGLVVW